MGAFRSTLGERKIDGTGRILHDLIMIIMKELDSTRSLLRYLLIQNEPIDKKISKFILGSDKLVIFLKFFSGCLNTLLGKGF